MSDSGNDEGFGVGKVVGIVVSAAMPDDDDGDFDLQPDDEPVGSWRFYLWMFLILGVLALIFRC